jgi:spermidine/putrescine transport system substrate-binding protein
MFMWLQRKFSIATTLIFCVFIIANAKIILAQNIVKTTPKIYLYNWNNYLDQQGKQEVEKTCNTLIVQDYYADNEEMLAKFAAGASGYDLVVPTQNAVSNLIKQKALKPLNLSLLPNFKFLKPQFIHQSFDAQNQFSVPYAYSVTVLGFNETMLQKHGIDTTDIHHHDISWKWFFDLKILKKMKGKVTVLDSQRELMGMALKYLGYSVNDVNQEHWHQAKNLIIQAKPYCCLLYTSPSPRDA